MNCLRTLGYAYGPACAGRVGVYSVRRLRIAALVGAIWSLVTGVFAVREALDTTTGNAVITVLIGWAVLFIVSLGRGRHSRSGRSGVWRIVWVALQ